MLPSGEGNYVLLGYWGLLIRSYLWPDILPSSVQGILFYGADLDIMCWVPVRIEANAILLGCCECLWLFLQPLRLLVSLCFPLPLAHGLWFDLWWLTGSCVWEKGICWHWELAVSMGSFLVAQHWFYCSCLSGTTSTCMTSARFFHSLLPCPLPAFPDRTTEEYPKCIFCTSSVKSKGTVLFLLSLTHPLPLRCFLTSPYQFHTPFYTTHSIATFWLTSDHVSEKYHFTFWRHNHCDV